MEARSREHHQRRCCSLGSRVRSPLDSLRKAVSSESGGIARTGRSAEKLGGKFLNTEEVVTNEVVAAEVDIGYFVLGRPGSVLSRWV